ncbi:MAG: D-glycero-beta-D-manno-heptose 1-phosphate adenylyltransferase [Saprospiraceae bacterium]|nr:D-glycero-beta-D-manno-heptose 1-phosphate adenylyltransferase [Saprospiraceae bacterium]
MSYHDQIEAKVLSIDSIQEVRKEWAKQGEKVVFTNGCFDILHYGHLHYLAQARDLGQRLIIGLNSDASVSRLKGAHRPIQDLRTRQMMLASLAFVDAVVMFEEDTPLQLIEAILPDVLVKGGDYSPETIVGAKVVSAAGGEVKVLSFIPGYSTSSIESKIKQRGI